MIKPDGACCRTGTITVYTNDDMVPVGIRNVHRIMLTDSQLECPVVTFEDIERMILSRTEKAVCYPDPERPTTKDPWQHRSSGMKCSTCMWFVLKDKSLRLSPQISNIGGKLVGRCRRHAPTMNGYPVCYEDDWCGDHKVDENKVQ
jgi:hypothetical protein